MIIGALEATDVEIKMMLYLPRDTASVPVSRQVLDGCLKTLGVTPDTRTDIALALSEACANAIQHAGPADEYEVLAMTGNGRCVIEVVNTAHRDGADGDADEGPGGQPFPLPGGPASPTAEHGRGLQIIDAVADNVRLTRNSSDGTTVHFEKELEWLPEATGRHLFAAT
ncbi:MAG TPA: ATP-binding protein [Streptosporangiaceae bacterium]